MPDYVDLFSLRTAVRTTAEVWARSMFGDTPGVTGTLLFRGLLGLRISYRASPDTIVGWRIAERTDHLVRLTARSSFITGELLIVAEHGYISLITIMRYDGRLGSIIWPVVSTVHRRLAPGLLRSAAAKIETAQAGRDEPSN